MKKQQKSLVSASQESVKYGEKRSISVASRKQKGRMLQKLVKQKILTLFPQLSSDDVRSTSMGNTGEDVQLSSAARKLFPYAVECKNIAKFVGYTYWGQAMTHVKDNTINPLVIVKANRKDPLVIISLDHFMELIQNNANNKTT